MQHPSVRATLPLAAVLGEAGRAWAGHGPAPGGSMNPWLEALLWGAAGLAVAMTIALIAVAFTRGPADEGKGERPPR